MKNSLLILTEQQRNVYLLRDQKMTYKKIGEELNISTNCARNHYQNALRRIDEYDSYNHTKLYNNTQVTFPITRGELILICEGLYKLTKSKEYSVTYNIRTDWKGKKRYKRLIIDQLIDRAEKTIKDTAVSKKENQQPEDNQPTQVTGSCFSSEESSPSKKSS